jgi:hypothetical protein
MKPSRLSYSGNPDEDLHSFMTKFNDYATLKDFVAPKTILALNTCISGHARVFLDTIEPAEKDSVSKVEKLLKDSFEGASWKWSIESQLLNRKQLSTESLDNYASDIMLWCRQSKKSQAETLSIFLRGLLPSLRAFVMAKQPETFRTALDAARLGIAVQECSDTKATSNPPQVNMVQAPVGNTLQSTLDTLTGLVSHMSKRLDRLENNQKPEPQQSRNQPENRPPNNRQRPQRNVACWRCGFTGHKMANCYAMRDTEGRHLN